ncbi:MAG: BrnT family toxin [Acidobacteriia bacterium]|nr:BrnT family toxin [Terriglobia bacterium]
MALQFEWDSKKAELNSRKHGVSFEEAMTSFGDSLSLTIPDPMHSHGEKRWVLAGLSKRGRLLVVVHVERGDRVRIISARQATPKEKKAYEGGTYEKR